MLKARFNLIVTLQIQKGFVLASARMTSGGISTHRAHNRITEKIPPFS